jgi:eukaryotic-like serine/threonine-protein kinase
MLCRGAAPRPAAHRSRIRGYDNLRKLAFGKYRLVAELGQGGMADVILALAQGPVGFNKLVVIKKLREHLAEDPEFVGMLIDEARLAARLNHPNIVHTNEVGEIDGHFFMAMEYLEGQPLTRVKRRASRMKADFSLEVQIRILCDVLAGLDYAHDLADYDGTPLNVVHRDVTPSNVFVTYEGLIKVVDFGIAKASGRSTETKTGVVKGKMTYMPPEQALGQEVDRRADLYSVGVMLWEALSGDRMWKGIDDVVVLGKLINGDLPRSPRDVNPDVPAVLDEICQKALAPDPDERFATASEFQAALEDWIEQAGTRPTNRSIGRMVTELFEKDREEIRQIIEAQLAKLKDEPAGSLEPVVIPEGPLSSRTPSMMASQTEISVGHPDDSGALEASASIAAHQDPGRRWSIVGLSVGLVAALGGLGWVMSRPSDEQAAQAAVAPIASALVEPDSLASATEPAVAHVRLSLRAVPPDATFSIDGGSPLDNPYMGEVVSDDKPHVVRVEADGYHAKEMTISFKQDVILDVTLEKERGKPRVYRPPPTSETVVPRDKRKKPDREIMRGNPWDE